MRIPGNILGYQDIREFKGYKGISWDINGYQGIKEMSGDIRRYQGR